jgi:hypothetical protein
MQVIYGIFLCLFPANQYKVGDRNSDYGRIMLESELALSGGATGPSGKGDDFPFPNLGCLDFLCAAGDLNYRLDLTREEVELALSEENMDMGAFLEHDQLAHERASGAAFSGLTEGPVRFLPTFKFDKGSTKYDTSKKRRIPAWTDRILFRKSPHVHLVDYSAIEGARSSDHRPVFAKFRVGDG